MDSFENLPQENLFKKKSFFRIGGFYFLVIFLILFLGYYFIFSAPVNFFEGKIITIEEGSSLRTISKNLKNNNVIRSRIAFESLVILLGGEKYMAPGDYLFENKQNVFGIAIRLSNRERNLAPIKVTIPEGFDVNQIADTFSKKLKNFDKSKFLLEAKPKEGYLFPDTYFFFSTSNQEDVLKYMQENFEKKIKSIQFKIDASSKTEKEIITMASIIEREAKGDADRTIISGILWNRISKNMPLQVDADMWTYKNRGLPENPICNPGLDAIMASINPANSSYLYYLHDPEGEIHYARTFEEHKINKFKYLK